jgi:hypothetical protein
MRLFLGLTPRLKLKPEGYAWVHAAAGEPFFKHIV